jgi:methionyl-tRNA synthetase
MTSLPWCRAALQIVFGRDGNFSEVAFRDIVNATLANSIGNMLNRCAAAAAAATGIRLPVLSGSSPFGNNLYALVSGHILGQQASP